jgi:hypothetical protein
MDWSEHEDKIIIDDYLSMLTDELDGKKINKAAHRRKIIPLLNDRTENSIQFKHQSISAILMKHGLPFIQGYKPAWNFQHLLEDKVLESIQNNKNLERHFITFTVNAIFQKHNVNFEEFLSAPPRTQHKSGLVPDYTGTLFKYNYLQKEQENTKLKQLGEELVFNFEKWRLRKSGKSELANAVSWISNEYINTAGYDIQSKNGNGTNRFIVVKTTKLGKSTPIYFTKNEFNFSREKTKQYFLYRVYNVRLRPRLFVKNGSLEAICHVEPILYKGHF